MVASATLGSGTAIRSAEKQTGGTLSQGVLTPIIEEQHETMAFSQSVPALNVTIRPRHDATFSDGGSDTEAGLGEFLARPVQLDLGGAFKSLQWTVSAGSIGTSLAVIDPWSLWQIDPKVKQKLSNFAYLKGTLKVRFVIAGTPFHYGRIQVTYVPFAASNTVLTQSIQYTLSQPESPLMYLSMGMVTELDPMSSTPVEMTLPFVHYKNWMDIPSRESLGSIYLRELVPLTRASDTAVASIAITAFVWMEGAELCVPTLAVPTSKREQTLQPSISGIASSVASAAGKLSDVPVIGKMAKATSIASTAAGDVAKLFGLSRPVDLTKPDQTKFLSSSSMSLLQGDSLAQKLTLDPQQEITIDPTTVGLPSNDEMTFESIVNRECWLTTIIWADSGGPFTTSAASTPANIGQLLFVANVTPYICKRVATIGTTHIGSAQICQPTPSFFISRAFNFWRGTMVYRFRVIASSFHRGNLRVTYDPVSAVQALDTNSQMTHILDISQARELIVRVPWCSQFPYLEVANQKRDPPENFSPALHNGNINFSYGNFDKKYHNGVIMASIVNQLVAPNSQPAYISVSSWMEDCEFQSPSRRILLDYPILTTPTSGKDVTDVTIVKGKQSSSMSEICFGERVTSVRALLKRQCNQYVLFPNGVSDSAPFTTHSLLPQFPPTGWADTTLTGQAYAVSYLTYFAHAYVMRRGGVRYTVVWDEAVISAVQGSVTTMPCYADYSRTWDAVSPGTAGSINPYYTLNQVKTTANVANRTTYANKFSNSLEGIYIANFSSQERLHEIEIPYYGGTRFSLSSYAPVITEVVVNESYTMTKNPAELGFQAWQGTISGRGVRAFTPQIFSSAAEDFSLFWFQAAPPIYIAVGT